MALSGTINGSTNNEWIDAKIVWTATQSIPNNTSTITAKLYYIRTNSGYTTHGNLRSTITINGATTSNVKEVWITDSGWTEAASVSVIVPHNSDGSKTTSISATGYINNTSLDSTNVSGTITLDTINRKAGISSAANFNDLSNPTIKYSNPAGNSATTLQACISLTGAADDIAYRNISKTGSSYTFNLTEAERNVLRKATTGKSRTVRFYVKSVIGGVSTLSYLQKTFSIVDGEPTLAPVVEDSNTETIALTGDKNKLIKYHSNAAIQINATANKYATLKSKQVVCGNSKLTANGTINGIQSNSFVFTATDSRGFTASRTITKDMVNYIRLTCDIGNSVPAANGDFNFKVSGNCFNGSFGVSDNTLAVYYRYKIDGGTYSAWTAMVATKSGNTYTATASLTGLDYQAAYIFQAYAQDALNTIYSAEKTIKSTPVFDWGKDNFNVNGTFGLKGKTVLRNNGDNNNIILSSEEAVNGVFIRPNGTGSATGQAIFGVDGSLSVDSIKAANSISIGGREIAANKVLWSGAHVMNGEQIIKLSENISQQPNGVELVFSRIEGNTADNANFNHFFVSKAFVATHGGAGSAFMMTTVNFNIISCKYLYIKDNQISGNNLNATTGTGESGIYYDNGKYCLRYVIGV